MLERRSLLSSGATAPTQMSGIVIMTTFVLTTVVFVASALVIASAIDQSASAAVEIEFGSGDLGSGDLGSGEMLENQSVYVVPMNPGAPRRRSRELQDEDWEDWEDWDRDFYGREPPGKPTITWDAACPKSKLQCKDESENWVDVSDVLDFSFLVGNGYEAAFGGCSEGWPNVSPYAVSHSGGVLTKAYKHLVPEHRGGIDNYMKSVNIDNFGDMLNDGGYSTTCEDANYFSEDNYTCGLQYITMAATYRGDQCETLRNVGNASIKINASSYNGEKDEKGYHRLFNDSAKIDPDLKKLRDECGWRMGKLATFDAMKKFSLLQQRDAFVKLEVNVSIEVYTPAPNARQTQPLLGRLQHLMSNDQLTENCKYDIVIAIGSPKCDAPIVVEEAHFLGEDFKENVSNYQLGKYGFEYNATNNLWHRKGVQGCDKGCCDDCFQWYCPIYEERTDMFGRKKQFKRDGSADLPYECFKYTYDCSEAGSTKFNGSSAQVCGVETDDSQARDRCV